MTHFHSLRSAVALPIPKDINTLFSLSQAIFLPHLFHQLQCKHNLNFLYTIHLCYSPSSYTSYHCTSLFQSAMLCPHISRFCIHSRCSVYQITFALRLSFSLSFSFYVLYENIHACLSEFLRDYYCMPLMSSWH